MVKQTIKEYLSTQEGRNRFPDLQNYEQAILDIWNLGCSEINNTLESKLFPLNLCLAYRILISDFPTDVIKKQWNLRCYSLITLLEHSLIPEKILLNDLRQIKKLIKTKTLSNDCKRENFLTVPLRYLIVKSEIFYSKAQLIINDDYIDLLWDIKSMVQYAHTQIESQNALNVALIKAYANNVKQKAELLFPKLLQESIQKLILIIQKVKVKNAEIESLLKDLSCYFKADAVPIAKAIGMAFDKKILKLILDPDINEEPLIRGNISIIKGSVVTHKIAEFLQEIDDIYPGFFNLCDSNYFSTETYTYPEFDTMFGYMIKVLLVALSNPDCYQILNNLSCFSWKKFKISEKYEILSQLPLPVSCIIMNIMNDVSNIRYQTYILKFFLKKINKRFQYQQITSMQAEKFIELALKEPIANILVNFLPQHCNLLEELKRVTYNIYFIKFPKKIGGITLKTQHIAIQQYRNRSIDHIIGAQFIIYIHELGHYLQRVLLKDVRSAYQSLSPRIDPSIYITEGGEHLENLLFSTVLKEVSLEQAKFLVSGNFPQSLNEFQTIFEDLGRRSKGEKICFKRMPDTINLRNCGSHYVK